MQISSQPDSIHHCDNTFNIVRAQFFNKILNWIKCEFYSFYTATENKPYIFRYEKKLYVHKLRPEYINLCIKSQWRLLF